MRVIAGHYRGTRLCTPSGMAIRPTSDRLRESIFNIIGPQIRGKRVLDLFAGTGAMGIEALSRGAESALFIDDNPAALSALTKNIKNCSLENRTRAIKWNILKNLNILRAAQPACNLVFIDSPYNQKMVQPTLSNLGLSRCLKNGAMVVIEHSTGEPIAENPPGFNISDQRRYGKTLVSFLISVL